MAAYVFKAMDLTGAKATGEVDAESKQVVADQLKARGLIVLDIKAKHASKEISLDFLKRIKPTELTILTRQLATMISSGMTILRALYVLEAQTENKLLADVIGDVLEESLLRVADQLEKEDSLRRQIKSAMVYPGVIMTFALIVLLALVTFLVPVFVGVFKQFGGDLPTITKFTVALSNAIKGQWWAFILATVAATIAFRKFKRSEWGRPKWDAFRLRVPMKIGDIVQKVALARWSRTLSALVSAGGPPPQ